MLIIFISIIYLLYNYYITYECLNNIDYLENLEELSIIITRTLHIGMAPIVLDKDLNRKILNKLFILSTLTISDSFVLSYNNENYNKGLRYVKNNK